MASPLIRLLALVWLGFGLAAHAATGPDFSLGTGLPADALALPSSGKGDRDKQTPYMRLAVWDLDRLGASTNAEARDRDLYALADVLESFDAVALVHVINGTDLQNLVRTLTVASGFSWQVQVPPDVNQSTVQDGVAVLYRSDRVSLGRVLKLPTLGMPVEPFGVSMQFQTMRFVLTIVCSSGGANRGDGDKRLANLGPLMSSIAAANPGVPLFLAGGFSVEPGNTLLASLSPLMRPAQTAGGTVLMRSEGRVERLVDNIWTNYPRQFRSGVYRVPQALGQSQSVIIDSVSSHVPLFVLINPLPA